MNSKNKKYVNEYIISMLIKYRKEAKMLQQTVADLLGISRVAYINIEQGRQNLSAEKIYMLSCVWKINVSNFFPPLKEIKIISKKEKIVIKKEKQIIKTRPIIL